jgi:hypothetical protein
MKDNNIKTFITKISFGNASWIEKMANFVTLFIGYMNSQHKRMEKNTRQLTSGFLLFTKYHEVRRARHVARLGEMRSAYKIFGRII